MKAAHLAFVGAVVVLTAFLYYFGSASAGGFTPFSYQVTVTSLTGGEYFAPIFMMTQDGSIQLFTPGQPPSVPLAKVAEAGNPNFKLQGFPVVTYLENLAARQG